MRRLNLWMMAAILLVCGMSALTSCEDDDLNKSNDAGPLAKQLSGTWFGIYEASGTAKTESTNEASSTYSSVIDIYEFEENGTGCFQRCFFEDDDLNPVVVQGILDYGNFDYSSTKDGKVNITLKHRWNQEYPQKWDVSFTEDTIFAKGVDGSFCSLMLR